MEEEAGTLAAHLGDRGREGGIEGGRRERGREGGSQGVREGGGGKRERDGGRERLKMESEKP